MNLVNIIVTWFNKIFRYKKEQKMIDEYLKRYDPGEEDPEELDEHWKPHYYNDHSK